VVGDGHGQEVGGGRGQAASAGMTPCVEVVAVLGNGGGVEIVGYQALMPKTGLHGL
jgi:hypothetical protein